MRFITVSLSCLLVVSMCTATPTGESTRSAMGEFSSRIQKRAPPKEKTPKKKTPKEKKLTSGPDDDEQYARLKTEYEEANQDTHTKCTESKKAELDFHDEAVNMNLNRSGMMTKNSYKASQRVTQHLQLPVETDPIKYVNELRKICKDAKKREADAKLKLRKYEDKNGYEKSQKHDKYQSKETMERLKAEAKQNEEA